MLTMVMRDIGALLVPEGDTVVPVGQHAGFIEHMAGLARSEAGTTTSAWP